MKASDPLLHRQLDHFAKSCRSALACDRVIIVSLFWDEEVESEATAVSYSMEDTEHEITDLLHTLLSAAATVIGNSPLELILQDKRDGSQVPFKVSKPIEVQWEEEDG